MTAVKWSWNKMLIWLAESEMDGLEFTIFTDYPKQIRIHCSNHSWLYYLTPTKMMLLTAWYRLKWS